jgi:UDP-glucose 4-epimerase
MKKIIVTGGCGFIGSNLVDILIAQGNDVTVIDDLSFGKKEHCNLKAKYVFDDFKKVLKNYDKKVDTIFHLAAEARIQPSFENPLYTCENNSYGTAIVCEYARKNGSMIVYAGSSSFYGGVYLNPYAFAKWQGEEVIKMYSEIYNIKSGIARFFNVYGPRNPLIGQYTPVVAIFEQQLLKNQPLTIVGDGEQRRDFTHVYDICQGLIDISIEDRKADTYNLGTGKNYSINELADLFGGEKKYLPARPGEARETLADTTKINKTTGWEANHDLTKYIKEFKNEII